jgi:hypothetical protein
LRIEERDMDMVLVKIFLILAVSATVGWVVPLLMAVVFSVALAGSAAYGVFERFPSPENPFITDNAFWILGGAYIMLLASLIRRNLITY